MARIRYIKPDFFEDTDLAELSIEARFLYIGLWTLMDRNGVYDFDPKKIKKNVFGYDDKITAVRTANLLAELIAPKFLVLIQHEGKEYIFCPTFRRHQKFHRDEKPKYTIPEQILSDAELAPYKHDAKTLPVMIDASASSAGNGQRATGNGDSVATVQAPPLPPAIASREIELSSKAKELLGQASGEALLSWWESYPNVDYFIQAANGAAAWILTNQQKAPKKFPPFFTRWLSRDWEKFRKSIPSKKQSAGLSPAAQEAAKGGAA